MIVAQANPTIHGAPLCPVASSVQLLLGVTAHIGDMSTQLLGVTGLAEGKKSV